MSEWKAKRFWKTVNVVPSGAGYGIRLDDRPVRTPAKSELIVPSEALAQAIALEWEDQSESVNPLSMPMTRSANAAIDKVTAQHAEVADLVAAYGDADLLCYRADGPASLVKRQAETWDPLLDWAADRFGARLLPVSGVMHSPQNPKALMVLTQNVREMDAFTLTAFHDLVGLSGSLVIGFAALYNYADPVVLWGWSRVDETWQEEQWGVDEEARELAEHKLGEFEHAKRFHDLAIK
ncbi:ATP12 family chaperone protein [Roseovarius rhodophyticola]|uniref:ATP12 family protein n=1 Tax=Roseovarius rhodophyticola TaxID=3080827 RepID=A0ABZ2TKB1_9RHOB|nr:ATP12 family protein [Roseovarius sp. W115]MDV2929829.1 ATP12 family protein [Roseovarius sp. W115]